MKAEQFIWTAQNEWKPSLSTASAGGSAQVAFLFGRAKLISESGAMDAVKLAYPKAHVFGCSTAGEIQNVNVMDETLVLTALSLEHSRIATGQTKIEGPDKSFDAGVRLAGQFNGKGLRHVFVLSEGLCVNASDLVAGMNSVLPAGVIASGGCAGDGNRLQTTHVWCDGEPQQSAAVALGFYGEALRVGVAAIGGWKPFGPDRLITRSKQNVLYEIDNKPALALYKQYLGEYAKGLPATGLQFPLELCTGKNQERVVRAILGVNEADQSITFAGNVPEGAYARFLVGHTEDLIEGTQVAARGTIAELNTFAPQFSILVSCNGRRFVLKQRIEEEVEMVREALGSGAVMTGFYSYGEIAPAQGGGKAELHNETMTITTFAEAA